MALRFLALLVLLVLALTFGTTARGEDEAGAGPPKPAPHHPIEVGPSRPLSAAKQRHIVALIDRLRGIDSPRSGLTRWSAGGIAFSPDGTFWPKVPEDHPAHSAWTDLVGLGPEAIPFLLERLDDDTTTAFKHVQGDGFGGTWMSAEFDVNVALESEVEAMRSVFRGPWPDGGSIDEPGSRIDKHVVTIGDCCFAILGEITNRTYEAMRGQPTACTVINSPTLDPRITLAVRRQWAGKDPRVELARRLMVDLITPSGDDDHGDWKEATGWRQAGAARRLDLWYGDAAEPVLVREVGRLRQRLDADPTEADTVMLETLSKSRRPAVGAAMLELAMATGDAPRLAAALDGLAASRAPALLAHIRRVVNDPSQATAMANHDAQRLLRLVGRRWPDAFEGLLREHFALGGQQVVWNIVSVLYENDARVSVGFWRPFLDITYKAVPWERSPTPAPIEAWRVCDFAALRISRLREDVTFDPDAAVEARDERIAAIRALLDKEGK